MKQVQSIIYLKWYSTAFLGFGFCTVHFRPYETWKKSGREQITVYCQ